MSHHVRPEDTLTLDHLPDHGLFFVYGTVDVWTEAALEFGNPDRLGWVSSLDQPDEPEENRDAVKPLFMARLPLSEDDEGELRDVIALLGAVESENGSTIYATDLKTYDMSTDETWRYAVHAHVKLFGGTPRRWSEHDARLFE